MVGFCLLHSPMSRGFYFRFQANTSHSETTPIKSASSRTQKPAGFTLVADECVLRLGLLLTFNRKPHPAPFIMKHTPSF